MNRRRAFVVSAYLPNGGTWMAYQLGRILDEEFGFEATAVALGGETPDHGIHHYPLRMPQVPLAQMEREITARDVLVVNPSFSGHQFGWRLPGFKISYVQGFSTFALLDRKLDHFVAVSDFVRDFLKTVYSIDANVIVPFVALDDLPPSASWTERPAGVVLPYRKGIAEVWDNSYRRLQELLGARSMNVTLAPPLAAGDLPHRQLLARLGQFRYFLTLSAAEGFGLVPLEAMAMGAAVVGYDGFGGRQYLRTGENSAVAPYPDVEAIADMLVALAADPARGEAIARSGQRTAAEFTYSRFRQSWIDELRGALGRAGMI